MDAWMRNQRREATAARRQGPAAPHRITFAATGDGETSPDDTTPPTDVFLEATDPAGEIAAWFDDIWWMAALRRWGDRRLTIHLLPSQGALLHPVVLHHLVMADRLAPNWRLVGHGYCAEVSGSDAIEALAGSAYDEVCLVEGGRQDSKDRRQPHALRLEDLFARVRRIQQQRGATRPILVRARSLPPVPGDRSTSPPAGAEPVGTRKSRGDADTANTKAG